MRRLPLVAAHMQLTAAGLVRATGLPNGSCSWVLTDMVCFLWQLLWDIGTGIIWMACGVVDIGSGHDRQQRVRPLLARIRTPYTCTTHLAHTLHHLSP